MVSYTEAKYAAMSDVEVVKELWWTVGELEDSELADEVYWLSGEILERFAPELEREATAEQYKFERNSEAELAAHEKALARREALRKHLRDFTVADDE